jgi:hypothetical protein
VSGCKREIERERRNNVFPDDVDEMREEYEDFRAHFKLVGTK